jgi:hypothetical protein
VVLLKEAQALVEPDSKDLRKFDHLRKRYLLRILDEIIGWHIESSATTPHAIDASAGTDLHCLASAIGCNAVLREFLEMIQVTRNEKGKIDSGAQRAFQMYEEARLHDILDPGFKNLRHSVQEAFQLYRQKPSPIEDSHEEQLDGQVPIAREDFRLIFQMYTSAPGYHKLVSFKQDMAALHISRIYHTIRKAIQEEVNESVRIKRRKGAPEMGPHKPGPKVSGRTYELLRSWIAEDGGALENLKAIRSHGSHLLHYEAACGRDHPLWMLLPTKTLKCPEHETCRIRHVK